MVHISTYGCFCFLHANLETIAADSLFFCISLHANNLLPQHKSIYTYTLYTHAYKHIYTNLMYTVISSMK